MEKSSTSRRLIAKPQPEPLRLLTAEELARFGEYLGALLNEDTKPIAQLAGFFQYLSRVAGAKPETIAGKAYGPSHIQDIIYSVSRAMFTNSHAGDAAFVAYEKGVLPAFLEGVKS